MKRFESDFTDCGSIGEVYAVIVREMELPRWFGQNSSAFWDALTGMIETPAILLFHKSTADPELADYVEKLIAIARRAENEADLKITVIE